MIDKKKENNLNKIFEKDNIYITEKDIKNHVYEKVLIFGILIKNIIYLLMIFLIQE